MCILLISAGNEFHSMGSLFSDSDVNNDGKNKTKTNRGKHKPVQVTIFTI